MESIRGGVFVLTLLAEVLCLLDMMVNSFAHTISTKPVDKYTRPKFTYDGPLAIDSGRHPILESVHNEFIANNIFLSEASNMVVVTGPNMSGKSTYLQQVCLVVILAQIGCYVPAHFATLRVVDRIFTRMGTMDSIESNSSTFMTEMKETAFILQNASHRESNIFLGWVCNCMELLRASTGFKRVHYICYSYGEPIRVGHNLSKCQNCAL